MNKKTIGKVYLKRSNESIPSPINISAEEAEVQRALGIELVKCPRCNRYWKKHEVIAFFWSGWNPAEGHKPYDTIEYTCWHCSRNWRELVGA